MRSREILGLALALAAGALLGLGAFTFVYGRGYTYLLDDPRACVNCHVMRDHFDTWSAATHRVVMCNDCHVPKGAVAKYYSKARNGWFHSYAFTFADVQVIRIRPENQRVLQSNCQHCHERFTVNLRIHGARDQGRLCIDCHRGVGHGL